MAPEQCGQLPHIFQQKIDFCPAGRTSKKAADFSMKVCRFFHAPIGQVIGDCFQCKAMLGQLILDGHPLKPVSQMDRRKNGPL